MKKRMISAVFVILLGMVMTIGVRIADSRKVRNVRTYTAFFATTGITLDSENEVKELIADKIGAQCEEVWLNGQTAEEAVSSYIANGEYPDFMLGDKTLYEAGALIPLDAYWEEYPNIYHYLSQEEWDRFRQEDGHIYWMPQFGVGDSESCDVVHDGEAFWIQTRVLKWAGYPKIRTLDAYFDVIEEYVKSHPAMEDGTPNIPFTLLCDDWRYFCLENPPQFLDGYPNDGSCMVDPVHVKVLDYNTTKTARRYFKKLNDEYKKGILDPESFTGTYEEYLDKLSTGAVLGMIDQWWDFSYTVGPEFVQRGLISQGCNYVPLPITISEDIPNQWHVKRGNTFDVSSGISITASCNDIKGALQFINDLLEEDIETLRFWGVEGEDYEVDEKGEFYYLPKQKGRSSDAKLETSHFCNYPYFPRREGIMSDGRNSYLPEYQQTNFYDSLPEDVRECLDAYGCRNYVDMLGSNDKPGPWYPMYSYSKQLTYASKVGRIWANMDEVKHRWLPQVVLSDDFDGTWQQYLKAYNACRPEIFFQEMQRELERRVNKQKETGDGCEQ